MSMAAVYPNFKTSAANCMHLLSAISIASCPDHWDDCEEISGLLYALGRDVDALHAIDALKLSLTTTTTLGSEKSESDAMIQMRTRTRAKAVMHGAEAPDREREESPMEYAFVMGVLTYLSSGEGVPRHPCATAAAAALVIDPARRTKLLFKCMQTLTDDATPRAAELWRLLGRPRCDCACLPEALFLFGGPCKVYWWWPRIADPRMHFYDADDAVAAAVPDLDFFTMAVGTSSISRAMLVELLCLKQIVKTLSLSDPTFDPSFMHEYAPGFFCRSYVLAMGFLHRHMPHFLKSHVSLFTAAQLRAVSGAVIDTVLDMAVFAAPDALAGAMALDWSAPRGVVGCKLLGTPPGDAFYALTDLLNPERRMLLHGLLLRYRARIAVADDENEDAELHVRATLQQALLGDMIALLSVASPDSPRFVFIECVLALGRQRRVKELQLQEPAEKRRILTMFI